MASANKCLSLWTLPANDKQTHLPSDQNKVLQDRYPDMSKFKAKPFSKEKNIRNYGRILERDAMQRPSMGSCMIWSKIY